MKHRLSINPEVSLIEIILSALIFAVTGIITLNCFASARFTQIKANDMLKAGFIVQSDIEIIKSFNEKTEIFGFLNDTYSFEKSTGDFLNDTYSNENSAVDFSAVDFSAGNSSYVKYFDENWNLSNENKEYKITLTLSDENYKSGVLENISVSVEKTKKYPFIKGGQQVYYIETKKFFQDGGSHGQ